MNLSGIKAKARELKQNIMVLARAAFHPRTPWYAKLFTLLVVAYAVSPIDLIPDFIPVLGYLDDLLLLPAGIWLAIKMIPADVVEECRSSNAKPGTERNLRFGGTLLIIMTWLIILYLIADAAGLINILSRS